MEWLFLIAVVLIMASAYFDTSNVGRPGEDEVKPNANFNSSSEDHSYDVTSLDPFHRRLNGMDDVTPDLNLFEHKI